MTGGIFIYKSMRTIQYDDGFYQNRRDRLGKYRDRWEVEPVSHSR